MEKNKQRSAACRVWQQSGRVKSVWEALGSLSEKLVDPDNLMLTTCMNILMEVQDELTEIGEDIYPEVERKEHN